MAENEVYCIYHSSDFDGICSAAIIFNYYKNKDIDVNLIPIDRGNSEERHFRECVSSSRFSNAIVYMVDYSVEMDTMYLVNAMAKNFIWIDHHSSAIKAHDDFMRAEKYEGFDGIRNAKLAACELTSLFLAGCRCTDLNVDLEIDLSYGIKDFFINPVIYLLGRYDVWKHNEDILNFQYGIRVSESSNDPTSHFWKMVLEYGCGNRDKKEVLNSIIYDIQKNGAVIRAYDRQVNLRNAIKYGKTVWFDWGFGDPLKCYVLYNNYGGNNLFYGIPEYDTYDMFIRVTTIPGDTLKIVSLYSETMDVINIAIHYGGGGHERACGFKTPKISIGMKKDESKNEEYPIISFKKHRTQMRR